MGMDRDYTRYSVGMGWDKSLIPVGFGDGYGIVKSVPAPPRCHP